LRPHYRLFCRNMKLIMAALGIAWLLRHINFRT
jgi:hypothetical protein